MLDHTLRPYIVSFKSLTNVYNLRKYVFFYYRQVFGGMVAVWNNVTEEQWLFMKEISSDGDVSTVRMCELYIVYKKVLMLAHKPGRTIFCRCVYMYKCFLTLYFSYLLSFAYHIRYNESSGEFRIFFS